MQSEGHQSAKQRLHAKMDYLLRILGLASAKNKNLGIIYILYAFRMARETEDIKGLFVELEDHFESPGAAHHVSNYSGEHTVLAEIYIQRLTQQAQGSKRGKRQVLSYIIETLELHRVGKEYLGLLNAALERNADEPEGLSKQKATDDVGSEVIRSQEGKTHPSDASRGDHVEEKYVSDWKEQHEKKDGSKKKKKKKKNTKGGGRGSGVNSAAGQQSTNEACYKEGWGSACSSELKVKSHSARINRATEAFESWILNLAIGDPIDPTSSAAGLRSKYSSLLAKAAESNCVTLLNIVITLMKNGDSRNDAAVNAAVITLLNSRTTDSKCNLWSIAIEYWSLDFLEALLASFEMHKGQMATCEFSRSRVTTLRTGAEHSNDDMTMLRGAVHPYVVMIQCLLEAPRLPVQEQLKARGVVYSSSPLNKFSHPRYQGIIDRIAVINSLSAEDLTWIRCAIYSHYRSCATTSASKQSKKYAASLIDRIFKYVVAARIADGCVVMRPRDRLAYYLKFIQDYLLTKELKHHFTKAIAALCQQDPLHSENHVKSTPTKENIHQFLYGLCTTMRDLSGITEHYDQQEEKLLVRLPMELFIPMVFLSSGPETTNYDFFPILSQAVFSNFMEAEIRFCVKLGHLYTLEDSFEEACIALFSKFDISKQEEPLQKPLQTRKLEEEPLQKPLQTRKLVLLLVHTLCLSIRSPGHTMHTRVDLLELLLLSLQTSARVHHKRMSSLNTAIMLQATYNIIVGYQKIAPVSPCGDFASSIYTRDGVYSIPDQNIEKYQGWHEENSPMTCPARAYTSGALEYPILCWCLAGGGDAESLDTTAFGEAISAQDTYIFFPAFLAHALSKEQPTVMRSLATLFAGHDVLGEMVLFDKNRVLDGISESLRILHTGNAI